MPTLQAAADKQSGIGQFCGHFLILGWCRDMAGEGCVARDSVSPGIYLTLPSPHRFSLTGLIWVLNHAITGPSELWLYSSVALEKREWLLLRGSLDFDKDG